MRLSNTKLIKNFQISIGYFNFNTHFLVSFLVSWKRPMSFFSCFPNTFAWRFFYVFRGYGKRQVTWNRLTTCLYWNKSYALYISHAIWQCLKKSINVQHQFLRRYWVAGIVLGPGVIGTFSMRLSERFFFNGKTKEINLMAVVSALLLRRINKENFGEMNIFGGW